MNPNDAVTITLSASEWEQLCRLLMAPVNPVLLLIGKIQQQAVANETPTPGAVVASNGEAKSDARRE